MALDSRTTPPGQITYEQRAPRSTPPGDSGEHMIDRTTRPRTDGEFTGLLTSDLQRTEELLTGRHEESHVLSAGEEGPHTRECLTEDQLRTELADAQAHGRMPVVMWVDSANEPFNTDSGGGSAGGAGAGHFVTITHYDQATGQVSVDNQWGDEHDHGVTRDGDRVVDRRMNVHDLFQASRPHDMADREATADSLRREVDADRARGVYDGRRDVALLLTERLALRHTTEQFDDRLVQLATESRQRWATSGEAHRGERAETEDAYRRVIDTIRRTDPDRAAALERRMEIEA